MRTNQLLKVDQSKIPQMIENKRLKTILKLNQFLNIIKAKSSTKINLVSNIQQIIYSQIP